jgi:hypothetical protein
VRFASNKSNGVINQRWAEAFNLWVSRWSLIEINPDNKNFTWTNNQDRLTMAKIDRVFVITDWEAAFPLARVKALERPPSDHNPLLINLGVNTHFGKKKFRFEKWWLENENFKDLVIKAWNEPCHEANILDKWQFRIRTFIRLVRGWASNEIARLNKKKGELAIEYNFLDDKAKTLGLSSQELDRLKSVTDELGKIWALEEIKAKQRSRDRNILEGDRNTAYFQAIANQRSRKKSFSCLLSPAGLVEDQARMLRVSVDFYKHLFAKENRFGVSLGQDFWAHEEKITFEENVFLSAPFTVEEIKRPFLVVMLKGPLGLMVCLFCFIKSFGIS